MEAVVCRCSRCGEETAWEELLGPDPLCAVCWDSEVDVVTPAERRALYREAHKAEIAAYNRKYDEMHQAERKAWIEAHRVELIRYRYEYYMAHKVERQEYQVKYQRDYYQRNRERIILRKREYRKARSCS